MLVSAALPLSILPGEASAYTPHATISINGNADFAAQAATNGWPGDGTKSNPYIIEGLDINAAGHGIAMLIANTNVSFKVLRCYLHNTYTVPGIGIDLSGVSNGYLANNDCSNNPNYGICVYSNSSNNSIFNNTCNSETGGIVLGHSTNNTVSKNICDGGGQYGILFDSSSNNVVSDNICNYNFGGFILISDSSHNVICNNTVRNNGCTGIRIWYASCCNNRIWNNSIYRDAEQAFDYGTNNWWNSSDGYGNWWSDWTGPDSVLPYGIVDNPRSIFGSANAKDYYPRTLDMIPPVCTITSPTSSPTMTTGWHMICLMGTATDDIKVTNIMWSNSLGGSGIAYMTPQLGGANVTWQSRGNVMLFNGDNVITVTAFDNNGHNTTDKLTVTYPIPPAPDSVPPEVTITAPTSNPSMTTGWHMIKLMGTASDDVKVTNVAWSNSLGGSGIAYMVPQWGGASVTWQSRGNVNLYHGDNVITVTATDSNGNTTTDVLTVTYTGL
jgi:parallel beta-helix repeat protein